MHCHSLLVFHALPEPAGLCTAEPVGLLCTGRACWSSIHRQSLLGLLRDCLADLLCTWKYQDVVGVRNGLNGLVDCFLHLPESMNFQIPRFYEFPPLPLFLGYSVLRHHNIGKRKFEYSDKSLLDDIPTQGNRVVHEC
eukprot:gene22288-biopygen7900